MFKHGGTKEAWWGCMNAPYFHISASLLRQLSFWYLEFLANVLDTGLDKYFNRARSQLAVNGHYGRMPLQSKVNPQAA